MDSFNKIRSVSNSQNVTLFKNKNAAFLSRFCSSLEEKTDICFQMALEMTFIFKIYERVD